MNESLEPFRRALSNDWDFAQAIDRLPDGAAADAEHPQFVHQCQFCRFLGRYEARGVQCDLWLHEEGERIGYSFRWGDAMSEYAGVDQQSAYQMSQQWEDHPISELLRRIGKEKP